MDIKVLNPKEEIRKNISNKFTLIRGRGLIVYSDLFLSFLDEMERTNIIEFKAYMASIIKDVYEVLKWKEAINTYNNGEILLLHLLENSKTPDVAVNHALSEENIDYFLSNIYCSYVFPLSAKINSKNNLLNGEINEHILKNDKLCVLEDFYYYDKKMIFSKEYKKEEYLALYDSLMPEYINAEECMNGYVDVIWGTSRYNSCSYRKLIIDMCIEFMFQKNIVGNLDEDNCDENNLLYLIKYFDVNHILKIVTENRNMIETLSYGYASYDYFESDMREQMGTDNITSETQKVLKKLRKGKLTIV